MTQFQLITLAMSGVEAAVRLVAKLTTIAKQRGELTVEEEVKLRTRQREIMQEKHWQIDPDPAE